MTDTALDFDYPWWLTSGHACAFILLVVVLAIGRWARWRTSLMVVLAVLAVWAGAGALAVRSFHIDDVPPMPTTRFLATGTGRVLDLGAGTGRSSIMVLASRPQATLVASDLFGESFEQHFGPGEAPEDRLRANLRIAGVDSRASIETADMRTLPFDDASFDAAVSAFAMDHLGRNGAKQALAEAHRVIRPGGDLLLLLIENDRWAKIAFGPLLSHGGTYGAAWWRGAATEAGFQVVETGTQPITLWILATKP